MSGEATFNQELAGFCFVCKEELYYLGGSYPSNVECGVDVFMKPHYGSKFADRVDINKSVKCFICDNCFEEAMKSLRIKSVLVVKQPFQ